MYPFIVYTIVNIYVLKVSSESSKSASITKFYMKIYFIWKSFHMLNTLRLCSNVEHRLSGAHKYNKQLLFAKWNASVSMHKRNEFCFSTLKVHMPAEKRVRKRQSCKTEIVNNCSEKQKQIWKGEIHSEWKFDCNRLNCALWMYVNASIYY